MPEAHKGVDAKSNLKCFSQSDTFGEKHERSRIGVRNDFIARVMLRRHANEAKFT